MLASILNSPIAVEASVRVVRAFILMREQLAATRSGRKIGDLEQRVGGHDRRFRICLKRSASWWNAVAENRREIGFHIRETAPPYPIKTRQRM